MATRKQREILRQRRMEFDRRVEENRKTADLKADKSEPKNESTTKKKRGRPPKKATEGDSK